MRAPASSGNGIQTALLWATAATFGAVSFGIVALTRGESVNAEVPMSDRSDRSNLLALFDRSGEAVRIAHRFATQTGV